MDAPAPKPVRKVPIAAWLVAAAADLIQFVALPFFGEGIYSPLNTALDVLVSIVLVKLLGWHLVLLPTLAAELLPVVDLAPTWTLSVGVVAFSRRNAAGTAAPTAAPSATPQRPTAQSGSHAEVVESPPPAIPDRAGAQDPAPKS